MARWTPPADGKFEGNEQIGRRLFELVQLVGASGQKPMMGLPSTHFEESRGAGDVSMDRLGRGCIDKQIKRYLLARCEAAAGKFKKPTRFSGWAVTGASNLRKPARGPALVLVASPIELSPRGPDGAVDLLSDNDYHAHVERAPCYDNHYDMANHLRTVFEAALVMELVDQPTPVAAPAVAPSRVQHFSPLPPIQPIAGAELLPSPSPLPMTSVLPAAKSGSNLEGMLIRLKAWLAKWGV